VEGEGVMVKNLSELEQIIKHMLYGHRLTKAEKALREKLQKQVKSGKITVGEAKRIWNLKVLKPHGESWE